MGKEYYVYIMSNYTRTVLYTGTTDSLIKRVWQHKEGLVEGFTKRYHVHDLVYYEIFADPSTAIEREKQIKNYSRKKKENLILGFNKGLKDLHKDIIE